uniref:Uncharacterized protein n=1 Tax=Meloidogyne enterolobii TaxID=390850 RepID=A0A6V7XXB0_MELEN|nr:unnamed protein product [Meloidogyne enterolobii]
MVVYNPLKLKTNNPELELYKFIEAKINFFTKNKKYKGEIEKTLKKIKWYTTELNAEEFESIDKLGHENYEMLDKLNFGVLLKIRGICSNLWHYFKELNGNMAGICSHEDFKIIFDKMLLDHNLNFKVEDKEVFEETAAKEALKYLNKIEEKAKGEVKEDVKVTKETKVKENKLNKTNKDLMNKKLGRSKVNYHP